MSGDALRQHLEREGLGHLYKTDGQMAYRLYKTDKRPELEAQGRQVNDAFEGIVAVYQRRLTQAKLMCRIRGESPGKGKKE